MVLLPSIVTDPSGLRPHQPLILVQSSASQTCLPVLRNLIQPAGHPVQTLLFCLLYPPTSLVANWPNTSNNGSLKVFDYTERVPGYNETHDSRDEILAAVHSGQLGSQAGRRTMLIADSTPRVTSCDHRLCRHPCYGSRIRRSDVQMYQVTSQPDHLPFTAVCVDPTSSSCSLLPVLTQTQLSATLTHIIAHPPALLTHLASSYLAPPPPAGSAEKFWTVFIPVSERANESEALVYGPEGSGTCSGGGADLPEFVVELIVRGIAAEGRKRGIERRIEAWSDTSPGHLEKLDSLKSIWSRSKLPEEKPADTKQAVSFNLKLTPSQEKARAQVPLPYAHEGEIMPPAPPIGGTIFYEPDSADDIDDDDPDEDLDI
ncbi:hypothetical protein JVT61DRAFT_5618 [Boletus reticuloceps]|uniref:Elongator complex protein 5 n=1 Tax=Boletus reticuloceps TaxID=495285 RepID=A0A8I3AG62_9AGAM|nr:hypothetical protein JVT61DRAFT_5618 [Boletus reticuloceps]